VGKRRLKVKKKYGERKKEKLRLPSKKLANLASVVIARHFDDEDLDKILKRISNDLFELASNPSKQPHLEFYKRWQNDLKNFPIERFHLDTVLPERFKLWMFAYSRLRIKSKNIYKWIVEAFSDIKNQKTATEKLKEAFEVLLNKKFKDYSDELKKREIKIEDLPLTCNLCKFKYFSLGLSIINVPGIGYPRSRTNFFQDHNPQKTSWFDICPCEEVKDFVGPEEIYPESYGTKTSEDEEDKPKDIHVRYVTVWDKTNIYNTTEWLLKKDLIYFKPHKSSMTETPDKKKKIFYNGLWREDHCFHPLPGTLKLKKTLNPGHIKQIQNKIWENYSKATQHINISMTIKPRRTRLSKDIYPLDFFTEWLSEEFGGNYRSAFTARTLENLRLENPPKVKIVKPTLHYRTNPWSFIWWRPIYYPPRFPYKKTKLGLEELEFSWWMGFYWEFKAENSYYVALPDSLLSKNPPYYAKYYSGNYPPNFPLGARSLLTARSDREFQTTPELSGSVILAKIELKELNIHRQYWVWSRGKFRDGWKQERTENVQMIIDPDLPPSDRNPQFP
jgi:hypothetical protein